MASTIIVIPTTTIGVMATLMIRASIITIGGEWML